MAKEEGGPCVVPARDDLYSFAVGGLNVRRPANPTAPLGYSGTRSICYHQPVTNSPTREIRSPIGKGMFARQISSAVLRELDQWYGDSEVGISSSLDACYVCVSKGELLGRL